MKRLFLAAVLLAAPALAQRTGTPRGPAVPPEAVERYHEAARLYVDGQNAPALEAAEAAVALAPTDAKAVALRDLIRQQQPPQGSPPPPQEDESPPDDGDGPPPPQEPPSGPPPPQPPQEGPGTDSPGAEGEPRMSPEQADRILDAVGGDERLLLRQMRRSPSRVRTNEVDW
ncbi:MAG TPA: hypothetical protein VF576_11535 [Rubricoccaceae bacterium]